MKATGEQKYVHVFIFSVIVLLMALALWIRDVSQPYLITDSANLVLHNDPWYNLRQIESLVQTFPHYSWYDPLTAFPSGKSIDWGPLYPLIAAAACLLAGATTRPEIVYVASWVSPVIAALTVPVVYLLGAMLRDWKTGLVAALIIAVTPSAYVLRTLFGYVDHHGAEVLFSALFCLCYVASLKALRTGTLSYEQPRDLLLPGMLVATTGVAYLLGLLVMPTMILFALIAGIYTILQFALHLARKESAGYLLILNVGAFAVPTAYMLLFGVQADGFSLSQYSFGHVLAYLFLICTTLALYLMSRLRERNHRIILIGGIAAFIAVLVMTFGNEISSFMLQGLIAFFGQTGISGTIREMEGWSLQAAWDSVGLGLVFMVFGFGILLYTIRKEARSERVFVAVWATVILLATILHQRYEYYLSIIIALLSAFAITHLIGYGWPDLALLFSREKKGAPEEKRKKKKKIESSRSNSRRDRVAVAAVALVGTILFIGAAISGTITTNSGIAQSEEIRNNIVIPGEWYTALEWIKENTPETGIDATGPYEKESFCYPDGAYGILSWWDYGHWITFISGRPANTNPFQDNLAGPGGAAAFFMSTSEDKANTVLDALKTRYVITDFRMATNLFQSMQVIRGDADGGESLMKTFFYTNSATSSLSSVAFFDQSFYQTQLSRLHLNDGSMTTSSEVLYIEYQDPQVAGYAYPKIITFRNEQASIAEEEAKTYGESAPSGYHAAVLSLDPSRPIDEVPALRHYRLVYESPTVRQFTKNSPEIHDVKVFEYIPGARITGEGVLELELETNTGRTFVYRQKSINGEFIVPYSTIDNPYAVKATGNYHLIGTDKEFAITEVDILTSGSIG